MLDLHRLLDLGILCRLFCRKTTDVPVFRGIFSVSEHGFKVNCNTTTTMIGVSSTKLLSGNTPFSMFYPSPLVHYTPGLDSYQ